MTIRDIFEYVDEISENAFSEETKLIWINQIEAEVQVEVLLMAAEGITQYTEADLYAEVIAPPPFNKIYPEYLLWRIMLAQGEAERANNQFEIYNAAYLAYVRFVCNTIHPASGQAAALQYYLTAYQIAVKHGYKGTETEWMDSLKGAEGAPGAGLNIVGQVASEQQLPTLKNAENDIGKGYLVGAGADALLYIWSGTEWFYKQRLSGRDGMSVTIQSVSESSASGGENIVNFSDGNSLKVKNGKDGEDGVSGENGVGIKTVAFKETTANGNVYTVTLTNEKTYDFTAPSGPAGNGVDVEYDAETGTVILSYDGSGEDKPGADGVGIYSITYKETTAEGNVYTITLTDGNAYDIVAPKGEPGVPGKDGVGIKSIDFKEKTEEGNAYSVVLTDDRSYEITAPKGDNGADDRVVVIFTPVYNEADDTVTASTDSNFDEVFEAAVNRKDVVAKVVDEGYEGEMRLMSVSFPSGDRPGELYFASSNGSYGRWLSWSETGEAILQYDYLISEKKLGAQNGVATLDYNGILNDSQNPMRRELFTVEMTGSSGTQYHMETFKFGNLVILNVTVKPNGNNPHGDELQVSGIPLAWYGFTTSSPLSGITKTGGEGGCVGMLDLYGRANETVLSVRTNSEYSADYYYYAQVFYPA